MAFFGGSTGIIYRQFSVTIISAMVLSLIVALVLTPALCATILRPLAKHGRKTGIFGWFNRVMDRGTNAYEAGTTLIIRRSGRGMAAFVVIVVATVLLFMRLPGSFLPKEDQGSLFVVVQLPVGATADRTQKVLDKVAKHLLEQENEAVEGVFDVTGYSLAGTGQNTGIAFISLKDFSLRKFPELSADAVAEGDRRLRRHQGRSGVRAGAAGDRWPRRERRLILLSARSPWRGAREARCRAG
jgi:multidrug efflux pump